jgi:hypothetical protein
VTPTDAYCAVVLFAVAPRNHIASLAVSQFLARERWTRSSQGFRGVVFAARRAVVGPGFARDDQLAFASRLISGGGGGLKLLRPSPVLRSLEKR